MFINLSNHPSSTWSKEQYEAAAEYGDIIDLPFPTISPQTSEEEISRLADDYILRIKALSPKACTVHVMGEQTFCFTIICRLMKCDYKCIASTTERIADVLSDGSKVSKFKFVKFRKYGA